jgi:hypothetical protein
MGELNYWTYLMTRWVVGWVAGSENKAHGKMDSLFAQPYISPPDYDTVGFPSRKEIILAQQSAVNEYESYQQSNATARQEVPPQQVDAGGMRMLSTMDPRACSRAAATLVRGGALPLCRTQSVRRDAWRNQVVCGMENDGEGCQGICAELFALCRYNSWRQSAAPAGYAATCNQAQRDPALRLPVHCVITRREVSILATCQG